MRAIGAACGMLQTPAGSLANGGESLCNGLELPIAKLCQLDPSVKRVGGKRLLSQMERSASVPISPIRIEPVVSLETQERERRPRSSLSVVAGSVLVPAALRDVNRSPSSFLVTFSSFAFE